MEYVDKVLIRLKRKYSKDEVCQAVIAQNVRYESEIEKLKSEILSLKNESEQDKIIKELKHENANLTNMINQISKKKRLNYSQRC